MEKTVVDKGESHSMNPTKRLYRSDNTVIAGVCGGIAEYFELDPTLIRLLTVFLVLAGLGVPILAYIIAIVVIPKRSGDYHSYIDVQPAASSSGFSSSCHSPNSTNMPGFSGSSSSSGAAGVAGAAGATGVAGAANSTGAAGSSGTAGSSESPGFSSAAAASSSSYNAPGTYGFSGNTAQSTPHSTPPGRAYTSSCPEAYDAVSASEPDPGKPKGRGGIRVGISTGIILVCVGVLALLGTFFDISFWRFWPLVIFVLGFIILCTPGDKGWSLSRAGHGISIIAISISLLLWTFGIVGIGAFWRACIYLWPMLLIVIGFSIIGSATKKSIFKLFGSLLFSITLIVGIWSFGQFNGRSIDITLPGGHTYTITVPAPKFFSFDVSYYTWDGSYLFDPLNR